MELPVLTGRVSYIKVSYFLFYIFFYLKLSLTLSSDLTVKGKILSFS